MDNAPLTNQFEFGSSSLALNDDHLSQDDEGPENETQHTLPVNHRDVNPGKSKNASSGHHAPANAESLFQEINNPPILPWGEPQEDTSIVEEDDF